MHRQQAAARGLFLQRRHRPRIDLGVASCRSYGRVRSGVPVCSLMLTTNQLCSPPWPSRADRGLFWVVLWSPGLDPCSQSVRMEVPIRRARSSDSWEGAVVSAPRRSRLRVEWISNVGSNPPREGLVSNLGYPGPTHAQFRVKAVRHRLRSEKTADTQRQTLIKGLP